MPKGFRNHLQHILLREKQHVDAKIEELRRVKFSEGMRAAALGDPEFAAEPADLTLHGAVQRLPMHKQMAVSMRKSELPELLHLATILREDRTDTFATALRMDTWADELDLGTIGSDVSRLKMHRLKNAKPADPL